MHTKGISKLTPPISFALLQVGRYDPTDDQFEKKSVPFELFMVVYVFTTVIVMVNLLIGKIRREMHWVHD